MCPFILLTFFFTIIMMMAQLTTALISVTFNSSSLKLHEGKSASVHFKLSAFDPEELNGQYQFLVDRPDIADIEPRYDFQIKSEDSYLINGSYQYQGKFYIKAKFLGYCRVGIQKRQENSNIFLTIFNNNNNAIKDNYQLIISVLRDKDLISKIFIYSVAIVVSISYINMGCALDLDAVYEVLRRPIAPAIGIFSQYVCMPLISFGLAMAFFDETYLKLGIFVFGCSPGGGASNMWTVLVNGNLNLSITMTFLSTLLSIGLMPFWLYTLGRSIFEQTTTSPPFRNIFTTLGSMVIFLGIGLLIKRYFPRVANISKRILAPFSGLMIIFIIVFGTYANFYMFKVMTWQMLLAAAINVWFGMLFGFSLSFLFRKPLEDMLAIAIETGVQNTGVSIVVLGLSLQQPDADLASAVPVAASIMTPIPLTIAWLIIRFRDRFYNDRKMSNVYNPAIDQEQVSPSIDSNGHFNYKMDMDDIDVQKNNGTSFSTQSSNNGESQYSSKANLKI